MDALRRWKLWWRPAAWVAIVATLFCFGTANVALRATWHEVEDGVLWVSRPQGVVAAEIASGTAADASGLREGDVLLAIDGRPVESPGDVVEALHGGHEGSRLNYTVLRFGNREVRQLSLQPIPQGNRALYYVFAAVAAFTLLVGLSVRLRRPSDQATLHFFWLSVAFFGWFAFSFNGRLDRLDWFFYWADVVSIVVLPPLFLHFALVFPERPNAWVRSSTGRTILPLVYVPGVLLGAARVAVIAGGSGRSALFSWLLTALDRAELIALVVCLTGGLAILVRQLRHARSVLARRQLRWIVWGTALGAVPFALGYALPFALGFAPLPRMELTALPLALVPLAFASAIVRYRLMDVEVIIKRGLVWTAALSTITGMYWVLSRLAGGIFLGGSQEHNSAIALLATLVVVLLARPVKNAIQTTLDRAYYRDRYDYRRALVGFARDLNSDLDLSRLSERLVTRVMETLLVDRMALMLAERGEQAAGRFAAIRAAGFEPGTLVPVLASESGVGTRLQSGHTVALDDPMVARRFTGEEVSFWLRQGIHYFVPCVSKEGTIAVMALGRKAHGEPLNSEDVALLAAVAGQIATALENGRLYQQLRMKASELDRLREFSENIVESLSDGLVVVDLEERVVRWNTSMERLMGIPRAAAVGQKLEALFEGSFLQMLRRARADAAGGPIYRVSLPSRHPDTPRRLLVNAAASPLRTPEGAIAGTIIILEDITARVQLEEQLQISEKMASIGLLAAGVAHEVNTPLTGISSFTQMLLEQADVSDPRTRLLEKIERQTFRAAKIVNGLLNLARPAHVDKGPVDLHVVVNDVLSLLEHQFKISRIQVRKDLAATAPIVQGVEYKLQQVFLNLFLNARDAMPKGGWLSIITRVADEQAWAEVRDTGSGIPTEHLSRIYDPFFSTKPIGQGSGLGLSISYGIVQEHGGSIACESHVGQGTRFSVALPLAAASRERVEAVH
ncbi:MAG: PAS domain-containing protein [Acidobacteria bacterium]|nr:PAS domain-containing protein [Acidobacteriota bacterium]